ncbi:MAG: flagellar type III secretion system pore protein FliP [Actinomycetota bacterium]
MERSEPAFPTGVRTLVAVAALAAATMVALGALLTIGTNPVAAQSPDIPEPQIPEFPDFPVVPTPDPGADGEDDGLITIDIGNPEGNNSQSVILIVGLAVLSLAPSLILMLTSFTRIIIVFSLTRNALGLQGIPPNQVLIGLALFLSLFVMAPTLDTLNTEALQPYLDGTITQAEAIERGREPVREFMLAHTGADELEVMLEAAGQGRPETIDDIGFTTLVPAFLLSELKTAFIIGFVIFIPFLIIDIVVAASLMALGMMMLPPAFISLPFKLLLFIMVGGWSLVVETLLATYT